MNYKSLSAILAVALLLVSGFSIHLYTSMPGYYPKSESEPEEFPVVKPDPSLQKQLPEYRIVHEWQQILETGLYEREYDVSRHIDVAHVVQDIESSEKLMALVVGLVASDDEGYTRSFFIRVLHGLSLNAKFTVIDQLIVSPRFIDQDAALSLAFEIEEHPATANFVRNVLASTPPAHITARLAEYVASHRSFHRSGLANAALAAAFLNEQEAFAKVSLLKVVDPSSLENSVLFDGVFNALSNNKDAVVLRGFDMLLEWQYHYPDIFTDQQLERLLLVAREVSKSESYGFDTRMRSLQYLRNQQSIP